MQAGSGGHFKRIEELKLAMANFKLYWINFNQPLAQVAKNAGHLLIPTVLLVADEVFSMGNSQLDRLARTALPNTLMESTMMR